MALEQEPEGLEAAHRVLRRVGPVDAEDHDLGSLGSERLPSFVDALVCGEPGERLGVDGERIRMRAQLGFVAATEQRLARLHERRAPALRVEPDAVAGQDALVDRGGDVRREHAPCVGPDPGDVDERGDACLWPNGADEGGRDVEVVVLHEQRRARVPVQLVDGGGREAAIDGDVAVCPRVREIGGRIVLQVPQPVLHEPEHRVGDHRVEEPVGLPLVGHEMETNRRPRLGAHVAGPPSRDLSVGVAHRTRHPDDTTVVAQRR